MLNEQPRNTYVNKAAAAAFQAMFAKTGNAAYKDRAGKAFALAVMLERRGH